MSDFTLYLSLSGLSLTREELRRQLLMELPDSAPRIPQDDNTKLELSLYLPDSQRTGQDARQVLQKGLHLADALELQLEGVRCEQLHAYTFHALSRWSAPVDDEMLASIRQHLSRLEGFSVGEVTAQHQPDPRDEHTVLFGLRLASIRAEGLMSVQSRIYAALQRLAMNPIYEMQVTLRRED